MSYNKKRHTFKHSYQLLPSLYVCISTSIMLEKRLGYTRLTNESQYPVQFGISLFMIDDRQQRGCKIILFCENNQVQFLATLLPRT